MCGDALYAWEGLYGKLGPWRAPIGSGSKFLKCADGAARVAGLRTCAIPCSQCLPDGVDSLANSRMSA